MLLTAAVAVPTSAGGFSTTVGALASVTTDTLDPPTSLAATRPCSTVRGPAPTFRSSSSALESGGTATVTKPAGVASGDLLVAFAAVSDETAGNNADTPSGWSLVTSESEWWGNLQLAVFAKVAGGSEPASYSFTGFDAFDAGAVVLLAYSGVDTTSPIQTSATQAFSFSDALAASVTVSSPPAVLVVAYSIADESSAATPSGMTARRSTHTSFPTDVLATFDETRPDAGATGSRSSNITFGGDGVGISLVVSAAVVVDPTVTLTWFPTVDAYADGYRITRTGGGTVTTDVAGQATGSAVDATTSSGQAYTFGVAARRGTWFSSDVSIGVAAC